MNLLDIAKVTPAIVCLNITARRNGSYVHRWVIGDGADNQPYYVRYDAAAGKVTLIDKNINYKDTVKKNGQPEMGWGLIEAEIPDMLLNAEITHMFMRSMQASAYEVVVDVELPPEQMSFEI